MKNQEGYRVRWGRDAVWVESVIGKIKLCPGLDFCERTTRAWEAKWGLVYSK